MAICSMAAFGGVRADNSVSPNPSVTASQQPSPSPTQSKSLGERFFNGATSVVYAIAAFVASLTLLVKRAKQFYVSLKRKKDSKLEIEQKIRDAPEPADHPIQDPAFQERLRTTELATRREQPGADLIVVASGKGGVGKSTIALGLLEAYSRTQSTLLIDFDMHNRGLTSLLRTQGLDPNATSVLSEMERFHDLYVSSEVSEEKDPHKRFEMLRERFSRPNDGRHMQIRRMAFKGDPIRVRNETLSVLPQNAYFLQSLNKKQLFLSSTKVFQAGWAEVFYFLKCLSYWAADAMNKVDTIILDCHGAHDLFMVGAIQAASSLVVVTTPEPGGFDGTLDLLTFSKAVQTLLPESPFPTILCVNNEEPWQTEATHKIQDYIEQGDAFMTEKTVVTVRAADEIRTITNRYEIGDVSGRLPLWKAITSIQSTITAATQRLANVRMTNEYEPKGTDPGRNLTN